jgi:hypothetical protein
MSNQDLGRTLFQVRTVLSGVIEIVIPRSTEIAGKNYHRADCRAHWPSREEEENVALTAMHFTCLWPALANIPIIRHRRNCYVHLTLFSCNPMELADGSRHTTRKDKWKRRDFLCKMETTPFSSSARMFDDAVPEQEQTGGDIIELFTSAWCCHWLIGGLSEIWSCTSPLTAQSTALSEADERSSYRQHRTKACWVT